MSMAIIDPKGTKYFYTDSGPPPSPNYVTLVLYHGTAWTGVGAHNIRLIVPNRRDYPGSSTFTEEEAELCQRGKTEFQQLLALDVANFLVWIINNLHPSPWHHNSGGIVLGAWSMGNTTSLALLGHSEVILPGTYAIIEPYLRKVIIYDAPFTALGHDIPPGEHYNAITDRSCSPEKIGINISNWLSGYYSHPNLSSRTIEGLDTKSKQGARSTLQNMSSSDMSHCLAGITALHADVGAIPYDVSKHMLQEQATKALFDERTVQKAFPRAPAVYMVCTSAVWYCVWGFCATETQYKNLVADGKKVRPMKFLEILGANHIAHWDMTGAFLDKTVEALSI